MTRLLPVLPVDFRLSYLGYLAYLEDLQNCPPSAAVCRRTAPLVTTFRQFRITLIENVLLAH
jgi:hypothetical protein